MPGQDWVEAAKWIGLIVGPAGIGGVLIAYYGSKRHKAKEPSLNPEAMAMIGQGLAFQKALDHLAVTTERNTIVKERLIDSINELRRTLEDRLPRRRA